MDMRTLANLIDSAFRQFGRCPSFLAVSPELDKVICCDDSAAIPSGWLVSPEYEFSSCSTSAEVASLFFDNAM